jgi:hypothetical protein
MQSWLSWHVPKTQENLRVKKKKRVSPMKPARIATGQATRNQTVGPKVGGKGNQALWMKKSSKKLETVVVAIDNKEGDLFAFTCTSDYAAATEKINVPKTKMGTNICRGARQDHSDRTKFVNYKNIQQNTPYKIKHNSKLYLGGIQELGVPIYGKDLKAGKPDSRAKMGCFEGYNSGSKAHQIHRPQKRTITVEQNIVFKENNIRPTNDSVTNSSDVQSEGEKERIIQYTKSIQDDPKYSQQQAPDNIGPEKESSAYRTVNEELTTALAHCENLENGDNELKTLWKELKSIKAELTMMKHKLMEVMGASEDLQMHIEALQDLITDGAVMPMKLPHLPTRKMTRKGQIDREEPMGGWRSTPQGFDFMLRLNNPVLMRLAMTHVNSSSNIQAPRPITDPASLPHKLPTPVVQTSTTGLRPPLYAQSQQDQPYNFLVKSTLTEYNRPSSHLPGLHAENPNYFVQGRSHGISTCNNILSAMQLNTKRSKRITYQQRTMCPTSLQRDWQN